MDFARKQLEKYGWSDGKGLGKNENGISEALKPKLKRSVTGIGHDPASEFNEHWWTALYDKAAKNVEVEEKNGKTKKIKTNSNDLVISSSTWKINKKQKAADESEYSEYFVRTAVLTNDKGGRKTENVRSDLDDENEDVKRDVFKMTDEELFAACEGRTAHKGARHGLRATGKLARIAEQEQKLLTLPQYQGYSHAKKLKETERMTSEVQNVPEEQNVADEPNVLEEQNVAEVKKKKKGKKSKDLVECDVLAEGNELDRDLNKVDTEKNISDENNIGEPLCEENVVSKISKKKKRKKEKVADINESGEKNSKKKRLEIMSIETKEVCKSKKKKKDKSKD